MSQPLSIAFIWHMHQPSYRDLVTRECPMPWVRLHAAKDYVDMVTRLEPFPAIHQTFNLVPSLLDQLEDYLPPRNESDEFLEISRKDAERLSESDQRFILQWFFLAHVEHMIKPYPRYHDLLAKRGVHVSEEDWPAVVKRFRPQDYRDLQAWFNLAWIDPWLRRQDPELARLEGKGGQFTEQEKRYVLEQHLALIARVIPTYREAVARGQIELSSSPYYHPILPLLCDVRSAQRALPQIPLPASSFRHPEDARWHLEEGLRRHAEIFGAPPAGLWPPEGSVSEEAVGLAAEAGVRWLATDEAILWLTLKRPRTAAALYRPHRWHRDGRELAILFRDRELSDLIGFVYSRWDPARAAADFLARLGAIHQQAQQGREPWLVSIVLDGENAWEAYPEDGHAFLTNLYAALAADPRFRCVTVSEFLQHDPLERQDPLPELFSGSWIDANFATWIGHPEKNAAWQHLASAREALEPLGRTEPAHARAWRSLGAAEGSDWMWWFGDTHFTAQADAFDRLFRRHVANCYRLAGQPVPEALQHPIRRPAPFRVYEPTGPVRPIIDGRENSYYEWLYAGRLDLTRQSGAAQRGTQCLRRLSYGCDDTRLALRLDLDIDQLSRLSGWTMELWLSHDRRILVGPTGPAAVKAALMPGEAAVPCALGSILEMAVPLEQLGLDAGQPLPLAVVLRRDGDAIERYPDHGSFELPVAGPDLTERTWSA